MINHTQASSRPPRLFAATVVAAMAVTVAAGTASGQAPAAPAATANASQGGDVMHVNADATFVRDAPNVRGKVVVRVERGERVEVVERIDGDWWRVRAGDPPQIGYVHRLVLSPGEGTAPRPARRPLPAPALPEAADSQPTDADSGADPDDTDDAPRRPGPGGLAFVGVGVFAPTARDSFDAVGITGNPLVVGGGFEATRVWRGLFVRGSVDWSKETGERAFVTATGERFPLGIPLEIRMVPIDVTAGWRFDMSKPGRRPSRVVPYAGGGAGLLLYRETDPFAEGDEVVDERFASYHVLGGVDVYLQKQLAVRAEFRYRAVPDALGESGASAITGDTSLGGAVFFVGLSFGR